MGRWQFNITEEGERDLKRLDAGSQKRVKEKLAWFVDRFDQITPLPLGEPWRGFFKLRVGDIRVVYEVEHASCVVTIHLIDRRDKIYKR